MVLQIRERYPGQKEREGEMTKQETYDYLNAHGISYEVTDHPAVFNMAELAEIELPYPEVDAKNLFVRDDKKQNYYLITVKGDKRVDLKQFRRQHGLRNLSFAGAEDLMRLLGLLFPDEGKILAHHLARSGHDPGYLREGDPPVRGGISPLTARRTRSCATARFWSSTAWSCPSASPGNTENEANFT